MVDRAFICGVESSLCDSRNKLRCGKDDENDENGLTAHDDEHCTI